MAVFLSTELSLPLPNLSQYCHLVAIRLPHSLLTIVFEEKKFRSIPHSSYPVAQDALPTLQSGGIFIVKAAGYNVAFLTLAAIAGVALLVFGLAMPKTQAKINRKRVTASSS